MGQQLVLAKACRLLSISEQIMDKLVKLGKGSQKKRQIINILWISVLPSPPLFTSAEVDNIHIKEFFIHIYPLPPSALNNFYQY